VKKVLIYEANSNQALSIAKYIKKYSNYQVIGIVEKNRKFNKKYYDKIIIQDFLKIDIDEFDYILPMGAESTYKIIDRYKTLCFSNNITFSITNLIVFNKPKMLERAKSINIPIPKTYYHRNDIQQFPIFYKENFENGGGVRGIAKSFDDIPKYDKLIYQEYIDTPSTYAIGFLAKDGDILTYFQHKEVFSYPKDGGSAVLIEVYENEHLYLYTKKLLKEINYNGWGLAEFKYCSKRKDFVFMEINAKLWASIEFMLINNPLFLNKLLDINYVNKSVDSVFYISRLFRLDLQDILVNIKYIFSKKIIKEESFIYLFIIKITPQSIINIMKRILK